MLRGALRSRRPLGAPRQRRPRPLRGGPGGGGARVLPPRCPRREDALHGVLGVGGIREKSEPRVRQCMWRDSDSVRRKLAPEWTLRAVAAMVGSPRRRPQDVGGPRDAVGVAWRGAAPRRAPLPHGARRRRRPAAAAAARGGQRRRRLRLDLRCARRSRLPPRRQW